MKHTIATIILLALGAILFIQCGSKSTSAVTTLENNSNTEQQYFSGELVKLADGFTFTEGPAVDQAGNVYFTDIPNNLILIWTLEGTLDTFSTTSNRSNGLYFDADQNLLACEMEKGRITSTSPDGEYNTIADTYNGKQFNATNDLWIDASGGVYFTDPKYGKDQHNLSQDGEHVYYLTPGHKEIIRVTEDLVKPNGIIGTADSKTLYVTDAGDGKTFQYAIQSDGTLKDKSLYVSVGADGMTIDKNGNLYLSTRDKNGIEIYSPEGKLLDTLAVGERVSNACFGGKNRDQLFITGRNAVYQVAMNTSGVD